MSFSTAVFNGTRSSQHRFTVWAKIYNPHSVSISRVSNRFLLIWRRRLIVVRKFCDTHSLLSVPFCMWLLIGIIGKSTGRNKPEWNGKKPEWSWDWMALIRWHYHFVRTWHESPANRFSMSIEIMLQARPFCGLVRVQMLNNYRVFAHLL